MALARQMAPSPKAPLFPRPRPPSHGTMLSAMPARKKVSRDKPTQLASTTLVSRMTPIT